MQRDKCSVTSQSIIISIPHLPQSQYIFLHDALKELIVCGETEIPAHALMTTVNQLKEPAAADEDTPTGFQRQFKVSDSILCSYYSVSVLCPITCANVFQLL